VLKALTNVRFLGVKRTLPVMVVHGLVTQPKSRRLKNVGLGGCGSPQPPLPSSSETFSIADCAAASALFYAGIVVPFQATHHNVAASFERLLERHSFKRVLAESRPYFSMFPLRNDIPARFLVESLYNRARR
jgi:hypothetical protein